MSKVKFRGGALLAPVPPVMVSCGDMEHANVLTVAWTGILNTLPQKPTSRCAKSATLTP